MTRFLLDTNHLADTITAVSVVRDRIQQFHKKGDEFGTCIPVLCELWVGLIHRADATACQRRLEVVFQVVKIWPLELDLPTNYAQVFHELKASGRSLSQVDITLASMCRLYDATLLTSDRDFEAFPLLKQENWRAA
ncbi:MAG: type II toxin-antitoxin system VapC family toxin [Fimbriiglobus sp.]